MIMSPIRNNPLGGGMGGLRWLSALKQSERWAGADWGAFRMPPEGVVFRMGPFPLPYHVRICIPADLFNRKAYGRCRNALQIFNGARVMFFAFVICLMFGDRLILKGFYLWRVSFVLGSEFIFKVHGFVSNIYRVNEFAYG